MSSMVRLVTALGIVAFTGCAFPSIASATSHAAGISPNEASELTIFLADTLAASMDPAKSTLQLAPYSGPDSADMQILFVDALRERGFALSPDGMPYPGAHVVSYAITPVGADLAVELDVDDASATCLYQKGSDGRLQRLGSCTLAAGSQLTLRMPSNVYLASAVLQPPPPPVEAPAVAAPSYPRAIGAPTPLLPVGSTGGAVASSRPVAAVPVQKVAAVPLPAPAPPPPPPPPPPPEPTWELASGQLIGKALQAWGQRAGWSVFWQVGQDWTAPASAEFTGSFKTAASEVITDLAAQGANIRAVIHEGNHALVVFAPGQGQPDAQ